MIKYITLLFALLLSNCQNTNNTANDNDCLLGTPTAIFSQELSGIKAHEFEASGQESLEKVTFSDGLILELMQSGCNSVKQEFQFEFMENTDGNDAAFWKEKAVKLMRFLGSLGEQYQPFLLWASFINDKQETINIGVPAELEAGHFVTIKKVTSKELSYLTVVLESK